MVYVYGNHANVNQGACRVGSAHIIFFAANCACNEVFGVVFLYHHFHQVRESLLRGSERAKGRRREVKRRATRKQATHTHTHTHTISH